MEKYIINTPTVRTGRNITVEVPLTEQGFCFDTLVRSFAKAYLADREGICSYAVDVSSIGSSDYRDTLREGIKQQAEADPEGWGPFLECLEHWTDFSWANAVIHERIGFSLGKARGVAHELVGRPGLEGEIGRFYELIAEHPEPFGYK